MSHPMSIDAEKLERFLRFAEENWDESEGTRSVIAAARAHLATLPRYKEVEIVRWGIVDHRGDCFRVEVSEDDTREWLKSDSAWQIVRLTGTAKVRA